MRHLAVAVLLLGTTAQDIYEYTTETAVSGGTSSPAAPSRVYVAAGGSVNVHRGGSLEIGAPADGGEATLPAPIKPATSTVYSVSGGSFSSPFFTIKDKDGNVVEPSFVRGRSYIFQADAGAGGVSTAHPFFIGTCGSGTCTPWSDHAKYVANGQDIVGTEGSLSFKIPDDFSGIICYYCVKHPSPMQKCFTL